MRITIIGNGITGVTAAFEIRRRHPDWQITMISGESSHFISRPALMYVYMGHMRLEDIKPYADSLWDSLRIELVQKWVVGLDESKGRVLLADGGHAPYDKLLLATGSKPNKFGWPGQDLEGVQGFYSLQDLKSLESASGSLRRAVIVGGGLIGLELAEMLHSRGASVTMLARESLYWNNIMPEAEARLIGEVISESGIDLRLETELVEIEDDGSGRACAVETSDGDRIECQLVGLTAGVSPNLSALEGSDIETGRGILVDEKLCTKVENVFAAGDCAEIVTPEGERNRIEQLWYTGEMQGRIAGRQMSGLTDSSYDRGIWFNSAKFIDLEWHTYGQVPADVGAGGTSSLFWQHDDHRHALRIVHDDGKVVGMNALGIRHRHPVWERWLAEERTVERVIDHLGEGNFDPEFYRRFEPEIAASFREQLR